MNTKQKIDYIVDWLNAYLIQSGLHGFVIGVSGGIDSAVVSTLCAKTGMPTLLVGMPIHKGGCDAFNASFIRASRHRLNLKRDFENVETIIIDLSQTYNIFRTSFVNINTTEMALVNSKARLRMVALYQLSAARGYLVAGTGNKVEDFGVGFFTKYGDGGVDISPIGDLYKSEVYEIGRELGIINDILNASPEDGLWEDNRTDESQLGATYDELEFVMKNIGNINEITYKELTDRQKEVLDIYTKHRNKNIHKMASIPICEFPKDQMELKS